MVEKIGRRLARPAITPDQVPDPVSSSTFEERHPDLFAFLSKERETTNFHKTGAVTIFWEGGLFKLSMNDRPEYRSTFVTAEGLGIAFTIADRGLRSHTLRWRPNKHKSNSRG